ncbi:MAG: class I SAM-dependent methyltransferase [Flavobacteriales bacterium]
MTETPWFASWFDTSYYHQLYNHRGEEEAQAFIERLVDFLALEQNSNVLDLACGKGRHARTLHALGLSVLGTDLSPQSIAFANESAVEGLRFKVQDMREPIQNDSFAAVFNLFTSFGYFDSTTENQRVIDAVYTMLNPRGILVIDFLNAKRVIDTLVPHEQVQRDTLTFNIRREIASGKVIKHIEFTDQGNAFHFTEQVQLLGLADFQELLNEHFHILHTFGDYSLSEFDSSTSPRLILIAQKR